MSAAESGIHNLMQNFDPQNVGASAITASTPNAIQISGIWYLRVDAANDPGTVFAIATPTAPTQGPSFLPMSGYAIGGGQSWGRVRYDTTVTGQNTRYGTTAQIGVEVGYGPVEISTMSR